VINRIGSKNGAVLEKYANANGFAVVLDVSNPQTIACALGHRRHRNDQRTGGCLQQNQSIWRHDSRNQAGRRCRNSNSPCNSSRASRADTEETVIVP